MSLSAVAALSRALHVLADLGVADAIDDAPVPASELAAAVDANADALHRLLRAVATQGLFEWRDGGWGHTAASRMLRRDHPLGVGAFARMLGMPANWDCLTHLHHSARTGAAAATVFHQGGIFGYLADHDEQRATFDAAMVAKARGDVLGVLDAVDFAPFVTIADIGGGAGHLVTAILDAYPAVHGALFDLPHVLADVQPRPDGRLSLRPGDFFVDTLPAADLAVLMNIVHDWDDTDAARILAAVGDSAEPGDHVMLIEGVLPEPGTDGGVGRAWLEVLDVLMLAVTGGRERTETEYEHLLGAAGYRLASVTPTVTGICVLDAVRVA